MTLLTLLRPICRSRRYCYRFGFSNGGADNDDGEEDEGGDGVDSEDGSDTVAGGDDDALAADDDSIVGGDDEPPAGDDDATSGDDNADNDAWSFQDDDANDGTSGSVGIRVIVLGAASDDAEQVVQVDRRLASNAAMINATFGCMADAAEDGAIWELFAQLGDGCYDMGITACGGGGGDEDDSASEVVGGNRAKWLTNELEIICQGLPCSLPFCVDSGVFYPFSPTSPPTGSPHSYSYSYNASYIVAAAPAGGGTEGGAGIAGGILVATTFGMPGWAWGVLLLLLLILLCCCCIFFLLCCGGGKKRKDSFVPMVPTEATVVTVEDGGGAIARRKIMRGADARGRQGTLDGATDDEAAFNPMVMQSSDGGHRQPTPAVARASMMTVERGGAPGNSGANAAGDFLRAEQGLANHHGTSVEMTTVKATTVPLPPTVLNLSPTARRRLLAAARSTTTKRGEQAGGGARGV